jgi:pyridoxine 5-phosphate synthase
MSVEPAIVTIAIEVRPDQVTLVPERRAELTTEGGLDVVGQLARVSEAVARLHGAGLEVSLFIDPEPAQIDAAVQLGAAAVELHTGRYADAQGAAAAARELELLRKAGGHTVAAGLALHAGHGLNYQNVGAVAAIPAMAELNIGHSIVARAVFAGIHEAVREMKLCMIRARGSDHF